MERLAIKPNTYIVMNLVLAQKLRDKFFLFY